MSHFYGTTQGSRGQATRCGTKNSGQDSIAASWEGCVAVRLYYNAKHDEDWALVSLSRWHGAGSEITLYEGPVSGRDFEQFKEK